MAGKIRARDAAPVRAGRSGHGCSMRLCHCTSVMSLKDLGMVDQAAARDEDSFAFRRFTSKRFEAMAMIPRQQKQELIFRSLPDVADKTI